MKNNDIHSLSHTKWMCKYHIVFAPKYRRKVFYGEKRAEIGKILRELCIMIYEKWGNMKYKYRNREFRCRGYYVDTVGKNTKAIDAYISNQLKEDRLNGQLTFEDVEPFKK